MQDVIAPIIVSHGEGHALLTASEQIKVLSENNLIAMQYVNNLHEVTENYPANPNGSPLGITGVTNQSGRVTILMPHPERVFRASQFSWYPKEAGDNSPWAQIFVNARKWVG
jgi:phosphoribosylformylglycinamidine synthase